MNLVINFANYYWEKRHLNKKESIPITGIGQVLFPFMFWIKKKVNINVVIYIVDEKELNTAMLQCNI